MHPGEPAEPQPTLVVADPEPVVRDGLRLLLRDEALLVVAATGTAAVALTLAERHAPAAMLVAERLPDATGLDLVSRVVRASPGTSAVLFVEDDERHAVAAAVRAGAAGVVARGRPVAQIARALRAVATGRTWFGEDDWAEAPLTEAAQRSVSRAEDLSASERRVLALVAAGASTDEIAAKLGVSSHTVRTHVRNLMRKLDAQSRAHAVAIAMRELTLDL